MAIIYTYPAKNLPTGADLIVLTDSEDGKTTKRAKLSSLKNAIGVNDYDLNATADGNNVDLNLTASLGVDNSLVKLVAGSNIGFYSSDSDPDDNDTFTIVGGDSFGSPTVKMTFVDNDNGNLSTFECVFEASNPVFDRAENLASGNPFLWGEVQVADFGSDGVCDKLIVSRTID